MCVCLYFCLNFPACKSRRIILSFVSFLAVPHFFSTLPHERHDFLRKTMERKLFVFMFCKTLV